MTLTYLPASQADAMIQAAITPSTTYYLGLCDGSPSNTGANEVTGGSYAEQAIAYGSASSGVMSSTDAQNFTGMPSTTVDHFLVRATLNGTYLIGGPLGSSLSVPSGATVAFAIAAATLTQSG
jgi:hypothetical protein